VISIVCDGQVYLGILKVDIVDKETRSHMMAAVKSRNTRYEIAIRKRLFSKGFRYKIHDRKLPGKPDIVLPKYKVIIFVNGCFWHFHGCHLSKLPKSRSEWWQVKLERNRSRDARTLNTLASGGWRVLIIWECSFRRPGVSKEAGFDQVSEIASNFILGGAELLEIAAPEYVDKTY
jgi:DNA mismatch endonuclease, patch repair protein